MQDVERITNKTRSVVRFAREMDWEIRRRNYLEIKREKELRRQEMEQKIRRGMTMAVWAMVGAGSGLGIGCRGAAKLGHAHVSCDLVRPGRRGGHVCIGGEVNGDGGAAGARGAAKADCEAHRGDGRTDECVGDLAGFYCAFRAGHLQQRRPRV